MDLFNEREIDKDMLLSCEPLACVKGARVQAISIHIEGRLLYQWGAAMEINVVLWGQTAKECKWQLLGRFIKQSNVFRPLVVQKRLYSSAVNGGTDLASACKKLSIHAELCGRGELYVTVI